MQSLKLRYATGFIAFLMLGAVGVCRSATLALSSGEAPPGGTISLDLSLNSLSGIRPAGIEWTFTYSPSGIAAISAGAGAAATAAGKSLSCAGSPGSYICVLTGLNANVIHAGVVAVLTVTVTSTTTIGVTNALSASATGSAIETTATGGTVSVPASAAPTVTTGPASAVTSTSATLGGSVNPNGSDTQVWFQYSANSSMSGSQSTPHQDIGAGTTILPFSANIAGLEGSPTYYFQAWASNTAGTSQGSIESFAPPGNCGFSVNPTTVYLDSTSQSGPPLSVATNPGCSWAASADAAFIHITSGAGGSGNGTVTFSVPANATGADLTGTLSVSGQPVSIIQRETAVTFTDVSDPSAYYFNAANIMYQLGISDGCSTTPRMFCPDDVNTRGQMAKFIVLALAGSSFTYNPTPYFTDVPASYLYFTYIQKLYELGITDGCQAAPAMFCPDDGVTRDQTAAFIIRSRFASIPFSYPTTPYFTDVPPSDPFFGDVQEMAQLGITSGCGAAVYCPGETLLRDDMAVLLVRGLLNQLLPASTPILTSVSPNSAPAGMPVTVTITGYGTHFAAGTSQVQTVPGITVANVDVQGPTLLTVQLTGTAGVTPNPSPIVVMTGTEQAGLPSGFTVQ
jgi:hypothetical protein